MIRLGWFYQELDSALLKATEEGLVEEPLASFTPLIFWFGFAAVDRISPSSLAPDSTVRLADVKRPMMTAED